MRVLLVVILIVSIHLSQAQQPNVLLNDNIAPSIGGTCAPIVLVISIFIGGAVYLLNRFNKRASPNSGPTTGQDKN